MRTLSFTLDDFLEQLGQVRQLGPLDELLECFLVQIKLRAENAQVDENKLGILRQLFVL